MPFTGFSNGGEGFLAMVVSSRPQDGSDPNAFVAPDQFLLAEAIALDQAFPTITHDVYDASRDSDKGFKTGKARCGGTFQLALYPNNGKEIFEAGLGISAPVAGIASDTTTAIQTGPLTVPAAPTATPSATGGTIPAGTYIYALTFVASGGGETTIGASTAGQVLTGTTSSVALSAIPVGAAGTTSRNIYRKLGAGAFGLIATLADNTTATYTDTGATAQGVAPPTVNTSLNNVSVLALTTGSANYVAGQIVRIDTGVNQEMRAIISYSVARKEMTVGLLGDYTKTHTSAGTVVVAPAQTVDRFIMATDFTADSRNQLPTICMEENVGGQYSYRYRGGYIGKIDVKSTSAKTELHGEARFNRDRVLANGQGANPSPTAFNEADASLNDLSFEYTDGFLAFQADPSESGTSYLQRVNDVTDWELNISNNLKEESCMDGTSVVRWYPGARRTVDLKFTMLNSSNRPVIYEDFFKQNKDATFQAFFAVNLGTPTAPSYTARSFHIPNLRYTKSTEKRGLTDTVGEVIEAKARRVSGVDKITSFHL